LIGGVPIPTCPGHALLYDPKINQWQFTQKMMLPHDRGGLAVVKDNFMFYVGGFSLKFARFLRHLYVLDLTSESHYWKQSVDMIVNRGHLGVGVINNHIYAVSYIVVISVILVISYFISNFCYKVGT